MASSFKSPILQAIDQNGDPVPGAKLYVYASGTITPVTMYSDAALSVALPNPIIANARGYFASAGGVVGNIFWNGQALRLLLTDASDVTIWQIDDYAATGAAQGAPIADVPTAGSATAAANATAINAILARLRANGILDI